jgi:hypothetical protein
MRALAILLGARAVDLAQGRSRRSPTSAEPDLPALATSPESGRAWRLWAEAGRDGRDGRVGSRTGAVAPLGGAAIAPAGRGAA